MNIYSAINQGVKILKNNFISNPYLDAEILMAKVINKDRNYILLNSETNLNINDLKNFINLVKKRSIGRPIAHLIGKKFCC